MKLLVALWRPALPSRLGILCAVLFAAAFARIAGVFARAHWEASANQATSIVLIALGLVPVFVAMLGAGVLRGEHAPWSWILARPRARTLVVGAFVALDLATVFVSVKVASLVLGGLQPGGFAVSGAGWYGGLAAGYVVIYLAAAVAGTRTASSIRAIVGGLSVVMAAAGLAYAALTAVVDLGFPGLDGAWVVAALERRPVVITNLAPTHPLMLWAFAGLATVAGIPAALVLGFVRAARSVPGRVGWLELFGPLVLLWTIATGCFVCGGISMWARAPSQAIDANISVDLHVVAVDDDTRPRTAGLRYDSDLGVVEPSYFARAQGTYRGLQRFSDFVALGAGRYDACGYFDRAAPTQAEPDRRALYEHCIEVELAPGEQRRIVIEVGADVPARIVGYF